MYRRRFILLAALLLFSGLTTKGQEVKVRAGFLSDSIRVGDEVLFYVAAQYNKSVQLVFPDTTFSYHPFEYHRKNYFPTQTKDTLSYDSAVYSLRTFEVDRHQTLRLPVFVVNPLDCTRVFSNRDTISIQQVVSQLPDTITSNIPLKATVAYEEVSRQVNTPLVVSIVAFVSLLAGVGWVGFGPGLRGYFRKRRMQKSHQDFIINYNRHIEGVRQGFSPKETESAIVLWKKYMENISYKPYTKLTTRETAQLEKDETLGSNLRNIDSAIYGHNQNILTSLESLREYADQRFNKIMSEVKNGQ